MQTKTTKMLLSTFVAIALISYVAHAAYRQVFPTRTAPADTLIILAGQSNMAGTGDAQFLPPSKHMIIEGEGLFDYRRMTPWPRIREHVASIIYQRVPIFGPEVSLHQSLVRADQWTGKIILKCALGGTSLINWSKTAKPYAMQKHLRDPRRLGIYDQCKDAYTSLIDHYNIKTVRIFWAQGETDATDEALAGHYEENLNSILQSFSDDLSLLEPHVFVVGLPFNLTSPYARVVRVAQKNIALAKHNISYIETSHIPVFDGVHYDETGIWQLGEALAKSLIAYLPNTEEKL